VTTFALIGAGPDRGLATARRFGVVGRSVALISRSTKRLADLTAE
jgi:short-subunit dehydrogenase